jgi:hypothetical protein
MRLLINMRDNPRARDQKRQRTHFSISKSESAANMGLPEKLDFRLVVRIQLLLNCSLLKLRLSR